MNHQEAIEKEFSPKAVEAFLNSHVQHTKEYLERQTTKEYCPMLILRVFDLKTQQMGDVVMLLTNLPKDNKEVYFERVGKQIAGQFIAVSALFISEAWMLSVAADATPTFRPSEHPASIEGFSFYVQPLKGEGQFKSFKTLRDANGNITMGDLHFEGKGEAVKSFLLAHFFVGYLEGIGERL